MTAAARADADPPLSAAQFQRVKQSVHHWRKLAKPIPIERLNQDKFWARVIPEPNSGCWLWLGMVQHGYGRSRIGRGTYPAHRIAYTLTRGAVPEHLVLDHLCRVRCCVNPDHLDIVTEQENILRGTGTAAAHAKKTIAKCGHAYDGVNSEGRRICIPCRRHRWKLFRRAQRAKLRAARD